MITSHPSAREGSVKTLAHYTPEDFRPPCAILCRNTAPLVSLAYGLLHHDIPCRIAGKDLGAQLATIVRKQRAMTLPDLRERLATWFRREYDRAVDESKSPERISDQYQCLCVFMDGLDEDSQTVDSVLAKIDLMFSDTGGPEKVVLSTIHRSKGLEWPLVFLLDWSLCPSKFATQPWQLAQERNLQYVAITRSQDALRYITSNSWKDDTSSPST